MQVAPFLGDSIYVSDDGSIQDEPLLLKIPELVAGLVERIKQQDKMLGELANPGEGEPFQKRR